MKRTPHVHDRSMRLVRSLDAAQRLVACIEAISYAFLCRRVLSTVAICSMVWLASLWLAAAIALAQESPSNESGIAVTQPAPPSIASAKTSRLVLGMIDRSELYPPPNFANQLANHAAQPDSGAKLLVPSNPQADERISLSALASAPSPSLLSAIQAKGSGHTDTASSTGSDIPLVYQLGAFNLVIKGLPNSFSVSSAGSSAAGAR